MQTLKEFVEQLPPDIQREVRDFAEFLLKKRAKRKKKPKRQPTFEWGGALKDLRDQYTSVELQHEMAEWRTGEP